MTGYWDRQRKQFYSMRLVVQYATECYTAKEHTLFKSKKQLPHPYCEKSTGTQIYLEIDSFEKIVYYLIESTIIFGVVLYLLILIYSSITNKIF